MIRWEIKKLFKNKSIIISSIILILLCSMMSFFKPDLETENNYFDKNGNYVQDNRAKDVIANEKLGNKVAELETLDRANKSNKLDDMSKKMANMASEKLKKDNGKNYKDISFYKVFNFRINNAFSGFVIVGICIYIFSNIYTDEKLSNVDSIILSAKNKYKTLFSKLYLSIIVPIVIYLVYILAIGVITSIQYGEPINGNLQAYRIVDAFSLLKPMTIYGYTMVNILTMMIVFVSVGVFASLFSFITNNSVESIVSITVFMVIGKIIASLKFLPKNLLAVVGYANYIDIIMNPQMLIGNYLGDINIFGQSIGVVNAGYIGLIVILIIGIVSNIYLFKKILNK